MQNATNEQAEKFRSLAQDWYENTPCSTIIKDLGIEAVAEFIANKNGFTIYGEVNES